MRYLLVLLFSLPLIAKVAPEKVSLFDGKTLQGWNVNKGEEKFWTVRDGMIVGGDLKNDIPHNTFLVSDKSYQNFELELDICLTPAEGITYVNSGIQVRSIRKPKHHEMIGYQVDAGVRWWGKLYDEGRRNRPIADSVDPAAILKTAKNWDWNHYRIVCEGKRIRSWINGVPALDYTEEQAGIAQDGYIGFQTHGGSPFEVKFKNITLKELPATPGIDTWESIQKKAAAKKPTKVLSTQEQKRLEKEAQMQISQIPSSPAKELAGFHLPEGFTAELVASEDQGVGKPISVQWDTAGRMWTMTAFEYPIDANENKASAEAKYAAGGKDKVLVFDNPYGPGPHTPRTFAEGLVIPLGMLPYGDGALVQYGTQIRYYHDKNNDGKAEGYDVILDGFGIQDSHLFVHQFERAPGGWIYLAQGLYNYSNVRRPDGKTFLDGRKSIPYNQCKLARFRPDGSEFEELTNGPNNIWGFLQKNNGETFMQEANDKGYPVVEYTNGVYLKTSNVGPLRSDSPILPTSLEGFQMGGTGLSGLALTEEKSSAFNKLHPDSENVFYIVNPITNRIQIVTSVRDANGQHQYKKQEDFLTSDDKWFRPVAAHFGPDGCLYIVDWYNKIISHNEVPRSHPDRDKTRGRIWRIRPNNTKPTAPPNLAKANAEQLIKSLNDPNERIARFAWHAIADRKDEALPGLVAALLKQVHDTTASTNSRVLAFWSIESLDLWKQHTADLAKLSTDKSAFIRFEVIRSLANLQPDENTFLKIASAFPTDPNYRVRAELAITIRTLRSPTPAIIALAAQLGLPPLAGDSRASYDRNFERYQARWAMEVHRSVTTEMLNSDIAQKLTPEAFLLAIQSLDPVNASSQLVKAIPRLKRPLSTAELSLLGSQMNNPKVKAGLENLFNDPKSQLSLLKSMELLDAKITSDTQLGNMVGKACLSLLKNTPSEANQALVVRLAAKFRLLALEAPIKQWMLDTKLDETQIISGLRALSEMRSDSRDVYEKYFHHQDANIKRQATIALAAIEDSSIVNFFASEWDKLPSDLRQIAIAGLTSNKEKANQLAIANSTGKFQGLTNDSIENLLAILGSEHPAVKTILKNTPDLIHPIIKLTGNPADTIAQKIDLKGAFTVEAWVKLDSGIGSDDSLLGHGKNGADINFALGQLRFYAGADQGRDRIIAKRKLKPNLWTHCAISRDPDGHFKIYLDGELDTAESKPIKADFTDLSIGNSNHPGGSGYELREFRIWDYARDATQIQTSYRTDFAGNKPQGLIHRISGDTDNVKFTGKAQVKLVTDFPKLITPAAAQAANEKFQKYLKFAKINGDKAKGKILFASCSACHKVGDMGGTIGPDLSGAGAMSTEALLHNILTPNAKMESGYYRHDLILNVGTKISGSLVDESKDTLSIQPLGGTAQVVKKSDIKKHTISKSSLMPEGLIDHMTPDQVADLFTYLKTLK